ncbi:putative RNA-directed DNA polymerase [Helianthus debilis subsp. tardiflorus]
MLRRLNNIIQALLVQAHLPPTFWVEALHLSAYLHNILPIAKLRHLTPAFVLYQRHPTYDHLRVFGCACYPNASASQPNKLLPRSSKCIFFGYPSNFRGYRCLDPLTGRVHISRHVVFDETEFPYPNPTPQPNYQFLKDDPCPFGPTTAPTFVPVNPNPSAPFSAQQPSSPTPTPFSAQRSSSQIPTHSPHPSPPTSPVSSHAPYPPPVPNQHPMVTRAKLGISKPNPKFNLTTTNPTSTISPLPTSYHKAYSDPNWLKAMTNEFSAL